jgi:hypothetical protein
VRGLVCCANVAALMSSTRSHRSCRNGPAGALPPEELFHRLQDVGKAEQRALHGLLDCRPATMEGALALIGYLGEVICEREPELSAIWAHAATTGLRAIHDHRPRASRRGSVPMCSPMTTARRFTPAGPLFRRIPVTILWHS